VQPPRAEVAALVVALRHNNPSPAPGEQAAMASQIIDAIYESSETGKEVVLTHS